MSTLPMTLFQVAYDLRSNSNTPHGEGWKEGADGGGGMGGRGMPCEMTK